MKGKIANFDKKTGVGSISLGEHEKPLFFNKEGLASDTTVDEITIGTNVTLNTVMGEFGPRASDVKIAGKEVTLQPEKVDPTTACVERLDFSKPAVEKVVEDAIIEEDRIIDKKEALKYLVLAAASDGVNLDSIILTEVFTDKNGSIIKLEAKSTDEKTGNYKLLTYQIKRAEIVDETNVDVSSWDKDSEYPNSGDTLAKYVGGQWVLFDNSKPKGEKWVAVQEGNVFERNEEGDTVHDPESKQLKGELIEKSRKVEPYAMWVLNKADNLPPLERKAMLRELIGELNPLLAKMKTAAGEKFENFHDHKDKS